MELLLFFWLAGAGVIAFAAAARGRSGIGWFFLALAISPLLALIAVLLLPKRTVDGAPPTPATHVRCPDCAELVRREARLCRHCGCRLVPQ